MYFGRVDRFKCWQKNQGQSPYDKKEWLKLSVIKFVVSFQTKHEINKTISLNKTQCILPRDNFTPNDILLNFMPLGHPFKIFLHLVKLITMRQTKCQWGEFKSDTSWGNTKRNTHANPRRTSRKTCLCICGIWFNISAGLCLLSKVSYISKGEVVRNWYDTMDAQLDLKMLYAHI